MGTNIVFVDEGTIDEVFGGEDSDLDENMDKERTRQGYTTRTHSEFHGFRTC